MLVSHLGRVDTVVSRLFTVKKKRINSQTASPVYFYCTNLSANFNSSNGELCNQTIALYAVVL